MNDWKRDYADSNLRMARKMLEQQEALNAAERRIAAALACHTRHGIEPGMCAGCGCRWDTTLDRCTSPTVTALTAETQ